ncbi:MAG: type IV pilus biogenesis protein PilM [Limisphaerales bacterium]
MKKETLGISWLNGRLEVASGGGDSSRPVWTAPERILEGAALGPALAEAVRATGFRGRRVAFVVDHRSLLFHVQEVPPASGRLLEQVLDRLVADSRFFEEPAIWTRSPLPPSPRRQRCLLALMPVSLWNDIQDACLANGLEMAGLHPVAAVLAGFLPQIGARADETILLIAELGETFSLLVGRGDGRVLFARSVTDADGASGARLEQEISRTLHFSQQQFGSAVGRVTVLGAGAQGTLIGRTLREGLVIEAGSAELTAGALARQVALPGRAAPFNFAVQEAFQTTWMRSALAAGLAVLLGASGLVAWATEARVRERQDEIRRWAQEAETNAAMACAHESTQRQARRLTAIARMIGHPDEPEMALSLARYLAASVPPAVRLTVADLTASTNGWQLHLEGATREPGSRFLSLTEDFESELQRGVLQLEVLDSTHRRTLAVGLDGVPTPSRRTEVAASGNERGFFVTGLIH